MTGDIPPMDFVWQDDGAMHPRVPKLADRFYVVGENYRLTPHEHRSINSHSHFFALIHEAFMNLPPHLAERFYSEDHLRRYALVKAGFCDQREIVLGSKADAVRVAEAFRAHDPYAVVRAKENAVIVYTAKSQSYRAMGKDDFQRSKEAVLDELAKLIGVSRGELEKARAA